MRGVVRVCVGLGLCYVGVQRGISYVSLDTPDEEYEHHVVSQYCSCTEPKKRGVKRWWRRRGGEANHVSRDLETSGGGQVLYGFPKCCLKTRGPRFERG